MRKTANNELGRIDTEQFKSIDKYPIVLIVDNVRSQNNIGSLFRTSDAFRIEQIVLCGISSTPPTKDIHKTALGSEFSMSWRYEEESTNAVKELIKQGYEIHAIEQVNSSVSLNDFIPDKNKKYALIVGNEVDGVSQEVVNLCHGAIEIPQEGTKHSLNVSVAAGVVLWHFFSKIRQ